MFWSWDRWVRGRTTLAAVLLLAAVLWRETSALILLCMLAQGIRSPRARRDMALVTGAVVAGLLLPRLLVNPSQSFPVTLVIRRVLHSRASDLTTFAGVERVVLAYAVDGLGFAGFVLLAPRCARAAARSRNGAPAPRPVSWFPSSPSTSPGSSCPQRSRSCSGPVRRSTGSTGAAVDSPCLCLSSSRPPTTSRMRATARRRFSRPRPSAYSWGWFGGRPRSTREPGDRCPPEICRERLSGFPRAGSTCPHRASCVRERSSD